MVIYEPLTNKFLLEKIEKLRTELILMFNNTSKDLAEAELVEKSQNLDKLINRYNSIYN